MRKSLIILFCLTFLSLGAHAIGIDCWEEYTIEKTEPTTSALRTAITNAGGTVYKLHTRALVTIFDTYIRYATGSGYGFAAGFGSISQVYLFNDGSYWDNYSLAKQNYGSSSDTSTYGTVESIFVKGDRNGGTDYQTIKTSYSPSYYGMWSSNMYTEYDKKFATHFVHTYCTINTSSGGGGGGATGSVNFIIKATS